MTELGDQEPARSGAVWQASEVSRQQRWRAAGTHGMTVWLTGLSGSGKSAVADLVLAKLTSMGKLAYVLDADNVRHGLTADLGFSPADRSENARRVGEAARLLADAGIICLVPIISPYEIDRRRARRCHEDSRLTFVEVFVDTPLEVCIARDVKGLYRRAQAGELAQFTGVTAPYEPPELSELHLRTAGEDTSHLADQVISEILARTTG